MDHIVNLMNLAYCIDPSMWFAERVELSNCIIRSNFVYLVNVPQQFLDVLKHSSGIAKDHVNKFEILREAAGKEVR